MIIPLAGVIAWPARVRSLETGTAGEKILRDHPKPAPTPPLDIFIWRWYDDDIPKGGPGPRLALQQVLER